jgi:DHA3 family macrolide efflux protein-like MFS transporter
VLIAAVVGAFLLGLLAGGRPGNLTGVSLRWSGLLFLAVALRYGTETAISNNIELAAAGRLPLYTAAFGLLALWLWLNRARPGLLVAAAGVLSNGIAVAMNGGWMPVWKPALDLVGFTPSDLVVSFHRLLPATPGPEFLVRGGPLGDLIPIPVPLITNVASIGDVFIAIGIALFVFVSLVRSAGDEYDATGVRRMQPAPGSPGLERAEGRAAPGSTDPLLVPTLAEPVSVVAARGQALVAAVAVPLIRPATGLVAFPHVTSPAGWGGAAAAGAAANATVVPSVAAAMPSADVVLPRPAWPRIPVRARIGEHPYVRLALDARFSALWLGQLVSLFGDRLHQVALAVLVLGVTGSPVEVGLVFLAATLPNLLVGPIAGTFVDRWNQKHVLVLSDLLRAGLVIVLPLAAEHDIRLVYPIVFAITVVSVFFRPARAAVLPRIVRPEDLTAANSAGWTAETLADIAGYPLAGLFVGFLGGALTLAFWVDAASYLVSAMLIATMAIPPVVRSVGPAVGGAVRSFIGDLASGWQFLRGEPTLFANTLVSAVAQLSIGATLALTVVYARDVLDGRFISYPQSYAAIDAAIGVGSLLGGFVIGAIGSRWRKGPLVIGGYVVMGLATIMLGSTGNIVLALGCAGIIGVSNMVFIIPTQTLFAERTPQDLMGRVVGIRFSIVFGSLAAAMAVSGFLAEWIGTGAVFVGFGALTALAGGLAALLPAVRDS